MTAVLFIKTEKNWKKNFNIRIIVVIKFLLKPIYTKNVTLADPTLNLEISYTNVSIELYCLTHFHIIGQLIFG